MRHPIAAMAALAGLGLAGAGCAKGHEMKPPANRSTNLPRPRDDTPGVRAELEAARRAGTLAAYDVFLARHGDHALAATARRERARLAAAVGK
jgi:hypothetical protein